MLNLSTQIYINWKKKYIEIVRVLSVEIFGVVFKTYSFAKR